MYRVQPLCLKQSRVNTRPTVFESLEDRTLFADLAAPVLLRAGIDTSPTLTSVVLVVTSQGTSVAGIDTSPNLVAGIDTSPVYVAGIDTSPTRL